MNATNVLARTAPGLPATLRSAPAAMPLPDACWWARVHGSLRHAAAGR